MDMYIKWPKLWPLGAGEVAGAEVEIRQVPETLPQEVLENMGAMEFTLTEKKQYALCNCKRTQNAPYCDGSHENI